MMENEMKFKAPEGCTEASVGGETFNVGEDGCITVPENGNYIAMLAPHGFAVAEEQGQEEKPTATVLSTPETVEEEVKEVVEEEEAFNPLDDAKSVEESKTGFKQNGKRK